MKISIVVPAYQASRTIDRCVASLVGQTHSDLEILLVNDGSTDDTPAKCRAWAAQDPRVVVIDRPNGGVSAARNHGLQHATGDYVAFVDADDWTDPEMYEKLLAAAEPQQADLAVCAIALVSHRRVQYKYTVCADKLPVGGGKWVDCMINSLTRYNPETALFVPSFNKIYKRSFIEKHRLRFDPNLSYAEDLLFNICFLKQANSIGYVSDYLYYYDTTTVNSLSKRGILRFFDVAVYLHQTAIRLFPEQFNESWFYDSLQRIEHTALERYARCWGWKGFRTYAYKIFTHPEFKKAATRDRKHAGACSTISGFTARHNYFTIYLLWCYIQTAVPFTKRCIKQLLYLFD